MLIVVDQSLEWPDEPTYGLYVKTHFRHLWKNAKIVYSNVFNVRWSVWWALASCMNFQVSLRNTHYDFRLIVPFMMNL